MLGRYDLQNLMFIAARIPQIWWNYKFQGTGQLHVVTRGALFLGNVRQMLLRLRLLWLLLRLLPMLMLLWLRRR